MPYDKRTDKRALFAFAVVFLTSIHSLVFAADEPVKVAATLILASNEGNDFDLVNDEFRDKLIELFSYKSYKQEKAEALELKRGERVVMTLVDGYELVLTLQSRENTRVFIQAVIRKESVSYVDTTLSVLTPGVAFLGGPPVNGSTLIIVLENGF